MTPLAASSALLKETILKAVTHAVANFKAEVGITPEQIHIRMTEVTSHSSAAKEFQVSHVELEFRL